MPEAEPGNGTPARDRVIEVRTAPATLSTASPAPRRPMPEDLAI